MKLSISALLVIAVAPAAWAQDPASEAVRGCRAHAALSTNAYYDDIFVLPAGGAQRRGTIRFTYDAWISDERALTGSCEADERGTVTRFDRLSEKTGRKPAAGSPGSMVPVSQGGFNGAATQQQTAQAQQAAAANQAGTATMDTEGRGNFLGLGMNAAITHSHVTLQAGRAIVVLTGGFNRISLTGQVTRQMSDREFEITIDGTDRTRTASGNILLRMTTAHNAAEEIVIKGQSGAQQFNGRFNQ